MDIRFLGPTGYHASVQAMQQFTATRTATTADSLWLCEHAPTYTLGLAGSPQHLLQPGDIPIVAHNAAFDFSVWRSSLDAYRQPYPSLTYLCSLKMAQKVW